MAPREASPAADPVRSACRQATFYDAANRAQCERLGPGRFWMVAYEEFCREPAALVRRVAQDILAQPHAVRGPLPAAFRASASGRVPAEIGARIDAILNEAGDEPVEGPADASAA
ncbi:MAG TPA: hypothetical protein VEQ85_05780 [Lacipirellulaceae bacterium]|nr:hypothetical protein [Lacipirellulaceae bacterium]